MKKWLIIICAVLAFILGIMIFLYMAEPVSRTNTETLQAPPIISAKQAILIDGQTGEVLYEKEADQRSYPASTTKIMTALTALKICHTYDIDIKTEVKIPKEAIGVEGSSLYLKPQEKRTIEDLLYGIMLRSGNDGAVALATILGGTTDNFVRQMNEAARALGCDHTHFVNPSGLFDQEHYTTARDLATIAKAAMGNGTFRTVVGTKSWGNYYNKNKTLFQYQGGTGVKIGYTEKSGRTLVASASREGCQLICVVLNDSNWFQDAYALMDYGFAIKGLENENEK